MNETKVEQLRMSLIQSSLDFMATISPDSYPAFAEVECRKIVNICNASPEMLQSLALMRGSARNQAAQPVNAADLSIDDDVEPVELSPAEHDAWPAIRR